MTIRMFQSTHKGRPCYAVAINGHIVRKYLYSHNAAAFMIKELGK